MVYGAYVHVHEMHIPIYREIDTVRVYRYRSHRAPRINRARARESIRHFACENRVVRPDEENYLARANAHILKDSCRESRISSSCISMYP